MEAIFQKNLNSWEARVWLFGNPTQYSWASLAHLKHQENCSLKRCCNNIFSKTKTATHFNFQSSASKTKYTRIISQPYLPALPSFFASAVYCIQRIFTLWLHGGFYPGCFLGAVESCPFPFTLFGGTHTIWVGNLVGGGLFSNSFFLCFGVRHVLRVVALDKKMKVKQIQLQQTAKKKCSRQHWSTQLEFDDNFLYTSPLYIEYSANSCLLPSTVWLSTVAFASRIFFFCPLNRSNVLALFAYLLSASV